jgi:hypothetical protein
VLGYYVNNPIYAAQKLDKNLTGRTAALGERR